MQNIITSLQDWLKDILIQNIYYCFQAAFLIVNDRVGGIAEDVAKTPADWNAGVFTMIRTLSNNVIVPIAGVILAYVLSYELLSMIIERNNLADIDLWMIYKWTIKAAIAIIVASHTFDLTMAIFNIASWAVQNSAGVIGETSLDFATAFGDIQPKLEAMEIGELVALWLEAAVLDISTPVISLVIMIILYGRMIEIYLYCSAAPIPFATFANQEWGQIGKGYLRGLAALGLQAVFIMVCVAIYSALITGIGEADNLHAAVWQCLGYTALLCFSLFRTSGLAKSILNAH